MSGEAERDKIFDFLVEYGYYLMNLIVKEKVMAEEQSFPRIPETNWWKLRNQFNKTLPTVVNKTYLKSLLGLETEVAANNLLSPLKKIGIIDNEGKPTERANDWRSDSKYSLVCKNIIKEVYPTELIDLYSGENIEKDKVKDWFKDNKKLGVDTANQCANMYILLNDAKPKKEVDENKSNKTNKKQKNPKKDDKNSGKNKEVNSDKDKIDSLSVKKDENLPLLNINLQVHISADATTEQIDAIFSSMAKHLYRNKNAN